MAWQSPYRGDESTPGWLGKVGPWVSRGVMLVVGVAIAYAGLRGMIYLVNVDAARPTLWLSPSPYQDGRPQIDRFRLLAWAASIGAALIGVSLAAAALLPVRAMQSFAERFMRPPVTGDRTGDDQYGITDTFRSFHRWWWWW